MKTHELKIQSEYFRAVDSGAKRFELRENDRDYQVGDLLVLYEYDGAAYTGRTTTVMVTYILTGPVFGLAAGYSILSIRLLTMMDLLLCGINVDKAQAAEPA